MKNLVYIFSFGILLTGTFGCKKGENDPFLSLKSRKARVAGEWKVSQKTSTGTSIAGSSSNSSYNGTTETTTSTFGGVTITTTSTYTTDVTFEKDGTYKIVTITTEDGESSTEIQEGNWAFMGKNKSAELKNKEAIALSVSKVTYSDGETESVGGTFYNYSNLIISQLKSKEIVFSFDEASTSSGGNQSTRKGSMTLTAK